MEQQGIYERIKDRVEQLKKESQDHFFTEYLVKLESSLIQEKHRLDLTETELERNLRIYQQRLKAAEPAGEPQGASADMTQIAPEGNHAVGAFSAGTIGGQTASSPIYSQPEGAHQPADVPQSQGMSQSQTAPQFQGTPQFQTAPQFQGTPQFQAAPQFQGTPRFQAAPQPQEASQPQRNHEFTIGINVFGTIGVLFVLAALILLGINYMGSLVKELGLYVLGLLVWGIAEFAVKRKSQILSMIFSSLGIGSLYVTTMVNYLYLHNFNSLITILITVFITVVVMLVSRKKDAGILRIICLGACMVSFLMMDTLHMVSDTELLIYMVMIALVQLLGIFLPVKKWAYGIAIGQIVGTALFAWFFAIGTIPPEQVMQLRALYVIGFIVLSMLLMELTVWRMPVQDSGQMPGICISFGIGVFLLLSAHWRCATGFFDWCYGPYSDIEIWIRLGVMAAIAAMGSLFFFLTRKKGYLRWMQAYFVAGCALFMLGNGSDEQLSVTITLVILTVVYKMLAYRQKPLWAADAIITTWTALAALEYHNDVYGYILLGILLLGILLMNHWQTYFEFILTGTVALYISMAVDNDLLLPLIVAVMWLASLLFNYVRRFVGKGIRGFNVTVLVLETACYLSLCFFQRFDSRVIYLILTVLGLGILLFTFQTRFFSRAEEWRGLAVAGFMTYMVLVARFDYRITSSILLMVTGLLGIAFGFRQTDRKLRIYGLVLCLLMCFKITLFDFRVQLLQRIILFMVAGVVALVISGIYALMDKKYNK